jgi:hypothetical protein
MFVSVLLLGLYLWIVMVEHTRLHTISCKENSKILDII